MNPSGRLLLIWRLVRGDIGRRRLQSMSLVAMIAATTATLTLALSLSGVTDSPFARTRAATKGPDVAGLFEPGFHGDLGTLRDFAGFRHAAGVVASSGPYPVTTLWLTARGRQARVHVEGRTADRAAVDQPLLTAGRWAAAGGVVLERRFAAALGVGVGDVVSLAGRRLAVQGIALTAAMPTNDPLAWVTRRTLLAVAGRSEALWYALNLRLADPARASAFAAARNTRNAAWFLESWQGIRADDSTTISSEQQVLEMGSVLLAIIAIAGIAVLVGGADGRARVAGNVLASARQESLDRVGTVLTVILLVIGAINLLFATWATVLDARRPTALARALGATPRQIAAGLAGAQLGPALLAAVIGFPLGLFIYALAGGNPLHVSPPIALLVAVIPGTLLAVGALTVIPARIGASRPVVDVLRSD